MVSSVEEDWRDKVLWFKGESHKDNWPPLRVTYAAASRHLPKSNSPNFFPPVQIYNRQALDALEEISGRYGEILPIQAEDETLFLFNVTHNSNAFDMNNSEVTTGRRTGAITSIKRYAFNEKAIGASVIFKIPTDNYTRIYVTEEFKTKMEQCHLTGFDFRFVWSST